jgi:hypothetical protein
MKLQFKVTAKSGTKTVAEVTGREGGVEAATLTVDDMVRGVHEAEAFLEKLTGLRWHIEQVA